jgi:uncharacterized membrane protein
MKFFSCFLYLSWLGVRSMDILVLDTYFSVNVYRGLLYTTLGMTGEVLYTGVFDFPKLNGYTQLWVMPLYYFGGLYLFEPLYKKLQQMCIKWKYRFVVYACMILMVEYIAGWLLDHIIGGCPWEYQHPLSVHGYIHLGYLPMWGIVGLLGERVYKVFHRLVGRNLYM